MRLIVNLDDSHPLVITDPTEGDLVAALTPDELWYGTTFALMIGEPLASNIFATSVSNGYATPSDPGEFIVSSEIGGQTRTLSREYTRAQLIELLFGALKGEQHTL